MIQEGKMKTVVGLFVLLIVLSVSACSTIRIHKDMLSENIFKSEGSPTIHISPDYKFIKCDESGSIFTDEIVNCIFVDNSDPALNKTLNVGEFQVHERYHSIDTNKGQRHVSFMGRDCLILNRGAGPLIPDKSNESPGDITYVNSITLADILNKEKAQIYALYLGYSSISDEDKELPLETMLQELEAAIVDIER